MHQPLSHLRKEAEDVAFEFAMWISPEFKIYM
ncbi:MAG: KilA-N domain-containing protein, partial [Clostridia bacterium]|nr:KilA-N domain-containing protein [Clostridia bacterium]